MTDNLLDQPEDKPFFDPNKNYLEELVGEGKKFKTDADLARGKAEADYMVANLIREKKELLEDHMKLRQEYQAGPKLQEIIDRLSQQTHSSRDENTNNSNEDDKPAAIKPEDIENLVSSKIRDFESSKKETENFNTVKAKLQERYGNNYPDVIKQQVNDLGLTVDDINALAKKSPAAFFRTLGLDQAQNNDNSFQAPPRSERRSDPFAPNTLKRTWSYYQKMRKERPDEYFNPKTSVQRLKDAVELGDAFNDGNFTN